MTSVNQVVIGKVSLFLHPYIDGYYKLNFMTMSLIFNDQNKES